MAGLNKVLLIGRLGKDVEVKYMPNGNAVATTSLATSESWKDKNSGEKVEKTEWHNLVFYRKLAEIAGEYLMKGSQIYVEGKIQTDKYQDKQTGQDRYSTKIVVDQMQMLGSKGGDGGSSTGPGHHSVAQADNGDKYLDDDIPF